MKSKISRICISFLTVLMVFISLPVMNASAARKTSDGIVYEISGREVTITDYTGRTKNLKIPSSIGGYPVTSIGRGAFDGCRFTSIEIPSSVTSIGIKAFYNCSFLTSIEIPEGVTSIGYGAFESCTSLTSITIPESVTSIGDRAFSGCSSLTDVYYEGSKQKWRTVSIGYGNYLLNNDEEIHYGKIDVVTAIFGFAVIAMIVSVIVGMWVLIAKRVYKNNNV